MIIARRSRIVLFLVLTFALSSFVELKTLPIFALMWCPGIAAIAVRLLYHGNLQGFGWNWRAAPLAIVSYLLPPALALVVYGAVWLTGIGGFKAAGLVSGKDLGHQLSLPATILFRATLGFLASAIFALGEEIGWRGFLVPELAKLGTFATTCWVSGATWAVWHYPLILFRGYNSGTPKWFALLVFTWMVVASSFVYAWMRLASGSLWPAVILHASHNLFVQEIFDPLTIDRGFTNFVTTEFGIGLAIAYTAGALYCWRRRGEVLAARAVASAE
jgi:membrane protease YdiL (CAAX protease family)